jgi:hypothetical protein
MSDTNETTVPDITTPRDCERCKGVGTTFRAGFTYGDKTYPDKTETCSRCNGDKQWKAPNWDLILQQITTGRGMPQGTRKMLAAFPSKLKHYSDREAARAYYVWRLARFHGGKDMTMPVTADMVIGGDPFYKDLSAMADIVAKRYFGSNMRAAARWAQAFGII